MQTTVQIEKETVQMLSRLKAKYRLPSYNKVIQMLAQREIRVPKRLFGAHPKLKPFRRTEGDFHEL